MTGVDIEIPSREISFRVGPLVNLERLVRSLGVDPLPIFAECRLDPGLYRDPDNRMPFRRSSQLLAHCVDRTGCESLGLLLGQMAGPTHLGLPGFLVHSAPTVEQALSALVEFLDLHDEGGTAALDIGKEFSSFSYTVQLDDVSAIEQINDLAATMIYQIMSYLCGPEWVAVSVRLERREPEDRAPYRRFFRTAIYFDSSDCEVTFSNQCLERKPPAADAMLFHHLALEAQALHDLKQGDWCDLMPSVLRRCLVQGKFSAGEVAAAIGIHERTFHRRLKQCGTSFRNELDLARHAFSKQLLENTNLPINEIATTMGYADASGFIRAFERWAGVSPRAWRKESELA